MRCLTSRLPVLLAALVLLGPAGRAARAADAGITEVREPSGPADWEALGLMPYEERLLAGLGIPLGLALAGTPIIPSPVQTGLFYGMCFGAALCPDDNATSAFVMAEIPLIAAGFSGMFAWADGQARGWQTGLRGLALVRWREGLQQLAMGITLLLASSAMTYADPRYDPIEHHGTIGWGAGLPTAALGTALFVGGQVTMDRALGHRRAMSPLPIAFGLGIFVPKLIVGLLALGGAMSGCEIIEVEEFEGGGTAVLEECGPRPLPQLGWPSLGFAAAGATIVILELATTRPGGPGTDAPTTPATASLAATRSRPPLTVWPAPQVTLDGDRLTVGLGAGGTW